MILPAKIYCYYSFTYLVVRLWPKIENLLLKLRKKLDHYSRAKFYGKSNGDSPVARKRYVLTQLKWYYGEKGFLSAVTIQKPEVNSFLIRSQGGLICMVIY